MNKNNNITRALHLLATNDFHGFIEENSSELGLLKYGTFLKNKALYDIDTNYQTPFFK